MLRLAILSVAMVSATAAAPATPVRQRALEQASCLTRVQIPAEQRDHHYTRNGRFTRVAIFDDEVVGYVYRHSSLYDPRRMFCEVGTTSRSTDFVRLYDDGTHGDDEANDGLYSNGCLSICDGRLAALGVTEDGYRVGENGIGILSASLRGAVPRTTVGANLLPDGIVAAVATSHAVLLTASTGTSDSLMPTYPKVDAWDHQWPTRCRGCKVAWEVDRSHRFEMFTHFSAQFGGYFDGSGANFVRMHDATEGLGLDTGVKNGGFGNLDGGNPHLEVQGISWGGNSQAFVHEIGHWAGIHLGYGSLGCCGSGCGPEAVKNGARYFQEDCAHLAGRCTVRSPQQGPMWDWVEWYPDAIPCDKNAGGRTSGTCRDGVTLGVNLDADGNLLSFRYDNIDEFDADDPEKNPSLYMHDDLMLYLYGLKSADEITNTYYCIGAGQGWESAPGGATNGVRDGVNGRPGNRYEVFAPSNTSFGMDDVLAAFGERDPPAPAFSKYSTFERTISHGALVWLDREYTEAEATWWTLYFRHMEDDGLESFDPFDKKASAGWGGDGFSQPFLSWNASTKGLGVLRSRIDSIPCGSAAAFLPRSCRGQDQPRILWPPAPPPPPCQLPRPPFPPRPPPSPLKPPP